MCDCLKYYNYTTQIYIKKLLKQLKIEDKNNRLYDVNNFIDPCFLKMQMDTDNNNCYLCNNPLKINNIKIYRLNQNQGFIKSNCFLICNRHNQ